MGAVGTWFGTSVRVAKMSNFVVGYGTRKIGVSAASNWLAQLIGTSNDGAAQKSFDAGWNVGGGASYAATAEALVKDIWDEADEKTRRLWPNTKPLDNQIDRVSHYDMDRNFSHPGFLEMTYP
jgi:hypothetical protein